MFSDPIAVHFDLWGWRTAVTAVAVTVLSYYFVAIIVGFRRCWSLIVRG